ncbi:pre-rRNA-processing protein esf2-like [Cimex lectularius]|uniref:Activator of basal transcription 1 n=1 Tax=Cimex lectularius TaxID=79782 RepID=A0A8I6R6Q5_CIMLE|nr:pre-rRNA-processing protein esf2-like [Cimex lectularius]
MFVEEPMPLTEGGEENVPGEDEQPENDVASQKDEEDDLWKKPKEIFKRGVVYLSFIPPGMTPTVLRNLLSKHAPVGRLFLQEVKEKRGKVKKKAYKTESYTEGWVEFLKKRHAKKIAEFLNNTKIGGKKKSKFHDYLWNLKYLPRFKWVHLVERLNYESALLKQRMRNEISQAKKIANHFKDNVDREERIRRKKKTQENKDDTKQEQKEEKIPLRKFAQRKTMEDIKMKKKSQENREDFLKNLFA